MWGSLEKIHLQRLLRQEVLQLMDLPAKVYGYRRICAELRRRGMQVDHKRVLRMMRKDNLLALRRRRFVVTTNSNHKFEVYLNLARRMKLSGTDQLWIADITYIRLRSEFVYLAVILDAFSRKVVGWALDRSLVNRLTISALERVIGQRRPRPGLVHHSDRGLQYARGEYVAILENYGIVPSMSRPANPYDNASCESFMKTLKREEIYANRYDNLEHMRANIEEFIEQYYSRQRPHSALGYRSPEEFEQQSELRNSAASPGATVQFVVNDENSENVEKASTGLSGEEDSNAVLFPRPLILLGDARTLLRKRKLCPKKLCHFRGSPHKSGNKLGTEHPRTA
jgi:putative transposase